MRKNRNSDVVTSSHQKDSDEEQEQSFDDSEEDWKPEKVWIACWVFAIFFEGSILKLVLIKCGFSIFQ